MVGLRGESIEPEIRALVPPVPHVQMETGSLCCFYVILPGPFPLCLRFYCCRFESSLLHDLPGPGPVEGRRVPNLLAVYVAA